MKVCFDDTYLLNPDKILRLTRTSKLFDSSFKLGATLCTQVSMDIRSNDISELPTKVQICDDNNNPELTLFVDEINSENINYLSISLLDAMVKFNSKFDASSVSVKTVQNLLNAMCQQVLGTTAPTISYIGDLVINWDDEVLMREFIGYIAEVNGCFARITPTNCLEFVPMKNEITHTLNASQCADIKLGTKFEFDRVVYDYGTATVKYPEEYSGTGNTYYVDTGNILLTDSGGYTRQGIIEHIYGLINGYTFYNVVINKCVVDDSVYAGELINILENGTNYPTIAQIDWVYNTKWTGGYDLDVEGKTISETQIISPIQRVTKSIKIVVDRELGTIKQEISSVNDDLTSQISQVVQTSSDITLKVEEVISEATDSDNRLTKLETAVKVSSDGIRISQGTEGSYTTVSDSGLDIYVNNNRVAWARNDGFIAEEFVTNDWHIKSANNGYTLNIFRKA